MTFAERLLALPRPAIYVLGAAGGALGSFSQAPFGLPFAMLGMLATGFLLFHTTKRPRHAFALGWSLAAAYFALSLRWIVEPFQIDAAAHAWMAPFALTLLAAGLALIWGAAFALTRRISAANWPLIFAWAAAEFFRAYALTGFPWANPAQGLLESWAGQGLSLLGPHGLTLLVLVAAWAVSASRPSMPGAAALGVLCGALLVPISPPPAEQTGHIVRLVQPNAPQNEKWDPDRAHIFVERQIEMTAAPGAYDLAVWSEMSIPYRTSVAAPVFEAVAEAAAGRPVLMGAMRDTDGAFFNSALMVAPGGWITQSYDKHHLVPFGEYMPLPWLFRATGIRALADRTDSGYSSGPGPELMDFGALGKGLPLICYEAVFPQDLRGTARPDFLINITNDAWFGQSLGPLQHLALSRMRAIEQGLPMIRVAGTGISAMIDPYGRVLAQIALNETGFLDAGLPKARPATLYSRTGDAPWALLVFGGLVVAAFRRKGH